MQMFAAAFCIVVAVGASWLCGPSSSVSAAAIANIATNAATAAASSSARRADGRFNHLHSESNIRISHVINNSHTTSVYTYASSLLRLSKILVVA